MSSTQKSIPHRVKVSFLYPIVGVIPAVLESGSIIRDKIVDFPALSSPISSNLAVELPMAPYKRNITMNFDDELPCGGYEQEDAKIKVKIQQISEGKDCSNECEPGICEANCKKQQTFDQVPAKRCKKCSSKGVLFYKGEVICQECLFKNIEYKCRLLLQNTFKVGRDSNLLVCFSGGLNSICLLNILLSIMKRYQKHKLFNKIGCLHIQQQTELPKDYLSTFQKITGVSLHVIKVEDALSKEGASLDQIRQLLGMFSKNANSIDLLNILRDRLILQYARKNDYHFVLKGLNGQTLATEIFRYFGKGLGGCLPLLSSNQTVKGPFYFPLRNNLQKQLQYYYYIHKLSPLAIKWDDDNLENGCTDGLDSQIKQFVTNLQHMFSHTAPAIVRTAEKIETSLQEKDFCTWCNLPTAQQKLCRRCFRVWEAKKPTLTPAHLPVWMKID